MASTYTEQDKAALSKKRGQAAASISDPAQRQKFIAAQGNAESGGTPTDTEYSQMHKEADDTIATQGTNKATNAPSQSMHSYKKGTDRVKKTGPAILHKDEAVLSKEDADKYRKSKGSSMAEDRTKAAMSSGKKKKAKKSPSGKKAKEVHVRRSKNGGYIVRNSYDNTTGQMPQPDEEYHANDMDELQAHMQEHMGQEEESGEGGSPAPAAGAGASAMQG